MKNDIFERTSRSIGVVRYILNAWASEYQIWCAPWSGVNCEVQAGFYLRLYFSLVEGVETRPGCWVCRVDENLFPGSVLCSVGVGQATGWVRLAPPLLV